MKRRWRGDGEDWIIATSGNQLMKTRWRGDGEDWDIATSGN